MIILCILCYGFLTKAQPGLTIEVIPYAIKNLPALHAYAFAQHDGKWLIIGGRTGQINQPSYLNYDIMVVDPVTEEFWLYPLEFVGAILEEPEHLGNCYAAHFQDEQFLYIAGGMGYSMQSEAFGSFPILTIMDVPKTMDAIVNKKRMDECFFQIENDAFSRQDALLTKINNRFYLVGGRQVSGAFDEEGDLTIHSDFSNDVFSFLLNRENKTWQLVAEKTIDYKKDFESTLANYAPQVFPDGEQGLTVFLNNPEEGNENLSWMNLFNFGYSTYIDTSANIAHYHSTIIPVFDTEYNRMHTLFIGGCDEYFCRDEADYAPGTVDLFDSFVRDENGNTTATRSQMDAFISKGRDAQFILNENVGQFTNKVIDLQQIGNGRQLIGYIYGGATAPGMMILNDGSVLDTPLNQIFKVYLTKTNEEESLGWQLINIEEQKYTIHIPLK